MNQEAAARRSLAFVALLAGAIAIGFAPIFVRLSDTSPTASAFWRVALAAPVLWAWLWASLYFSSLPVGEGPGQRAKLTTGTLRILILTGLMFACDLGAWHVSVAWTSVANSTLEANFAPIFVTLGAWLLWKQRPTALFVVALAITLAGAVLLIGPNYNAGGTAFIGDALGVLTAVFYAGYMLSLKVATGRASTLRIMAVSTTVSAIALLPYALITADQFWPQGSEGWLVLAALALLPHVAGQSLIAWGFARLPAALSSVSLLLQVVVATLCAWLLLGEAMQPVQMAGGAIVLAGIYLARRTG